MAVMPGSTSAITPAAKLKRPPNNCAHHGPLFQRPINPTSEKMPSPRAKNA